MLNLRFPLFFSILPVTGTKGQNDKAFRPSGTCLLYQLTILSRTHCELHPKHQSLTDGIICLSKCQRLLLTNTKLRNDGTVTLNILFLEVVEQVASVTYHLMKSAS